MTANETLTRRTGAPPNNDDLAAFVAGLADAATTRRVSRAALADSAVRETVRTMTVDHEAAFASAFDVTPLADADASRAESLKSRLRLATISFARETSPAIAAAQIAETAANSGGIVGIVARAIQTGRALLTLPCLAPATAAPAIDATAPLQRNVVHAADGVRIEFQQLPGQPPYRVRVVVDASDSDTEPGAYTVAYLTLEEDETASVTGELIASARHLLIVPMRADLRGFADFVVGGSGPTGLAMPRSTCRLVGATLAAGQ